jgi:hypothetical protein
MKRDTEIAWTRHCSADWQQNGQFWCLRVVGAQVLIARDGGLDLLDPADQFRDKAGSRYAARVARR